MNHCFFNVERARPEITYEHPSSGLCVGVRFGDNIKLFLQFEDLETWWKFRKGLPKGKHYVFQTGNQRITNRKKAKKAAKHFYKTSKKREKELSR